MFKSNTCKICGETFPHGLGGHMKKHNVAFEALADHRSKKRRLIAECGHRCQVCQNEHWLEQAIPLEIDHIDGNSSNNERENLRLICPNCHALTDTYRGRNIGKNPDLKRAETLKKHYGKYR